MKLAKGVASHLPVLLEVGKIFGKEIKNIVELGSGLVSTRLFLDKDYFPNVEKLTSYEFLQEWFDKLNELIDDERFDYRLYKDYEEIEVATGDLLFVDGNRKHRNKVLRDFHNNFKLVICHDIDLKWFTANSRYYFKFMWEYTPPGRQTGVMSNFIDVGSIKWDCKTDKKLEKLWLSVEAKKLRRQK